MHYFLTHHYLLLYSSVIKRIITNMFWYLWSVEEKGELHKNITKPEEESHINKEMGGKVG